MDIQELIRVKRQQITLLQRHIKSLEEMAAEEKALSADALRPGSSRATKQGRPRMSRRGRRQGPSRAAQVEVYLKAHPGPQPATEIAAATGLAPAEVHSAIHSGLKGGRFVRGSERATYALGGTKDEPSVRPKARRKRTKRGPGKASKMRKNTAKARGNAAVAKADTPKQATP